MRQGLGHVGRATVTKRMGCKTKVPVVITFGEEAATVLQTLPRFGTLFPWLSGLHEKHRAKHFIKRLATVGIAGVSLHSYRYAWAERAKVAGMPERFAQQVPCPQFQGICAGVFQECKGDRSLPGRLRGENRADANGRESISQDGARSVFTRQRTRPRSRSTKIGMKA